MQQHRLSEAKYGALLRLTKVDRPNNAHVLRLCELGLVPGALLEIARDTTLAMPLLILVNGTQLCIERSLAANFWVEVGAQQ